LLVPSGRIDARLSSLLRHVMRWDASSRGASPPSHQRCTGASVVLLAVHANCDCLVLRSLLAGLFVRPVMSSFRIGNGACFFLRNLRILGSLSSVPKGQPRGFGRSVVLIGGCWATVELIAALLDAYRRRRCGVVCSMWVIHGFSHRCVLAACEVRRSEAAGVVVSSRFAETLFAESWKSTQYM